MKFDFATSVLTSLLMADPVLAQVAAQRQKKKRIMDSQVMEEMEEPLHLFQDRNKNHEHLVELEGTNKLHHDQLHQRNQKVQSVPSHMNTVKMHDDEDVEEMDLNEYDDYDDYDSFEEADGSSQEATAPDVGILYVDDEHAQALNRNLRRRRKQAPTNCYQEIFAVLRKKGKKFEQPFCEQDLSYWNIADGNTFFYGGYCECNVQCPKAKVTHCCAKGCLQCNDASGKPKHAKCGQFTAASFK